jgi:enamine deaminase RidA (YjgF/YER057c/UK114 family)
MISRLHIGPRMSQAVVHGDTVYIAGQVADDRKGSIESQTQQVLAKIDALLEAAGTDRSKLLAVSVFLPQITDFDAMNKVYDNWIDKKNPPIRACVEARLADPDLRIEMTAMAAVRNA